MRCSPTVRSYGCENWTALTSRWWPDLDLAPAEGYLDALAQREEHADVASLSAVLSPRSIVVIGAARSPDSVGHAVLQSLVRAGFTGRLAAVNPHAAEVCGVVCHRSVEELPSPVDLAVVCVPAAAVPEVAQQCGRAGVRGLLVISSGLSADPALAEGLLDAARRYDMRRRSCAGWALASRRRCRQATSTTSAATT